MKEGEKDDHLQITIFRTAVLLNCGFLSGLLQAFLFNPWDRALYLSVKNDKPFLRIENFEKPMAGVLQTVIQRAISSGLYFPLEEIFADLISVKAEKNESLKSWKLLFAGTMAGAINGVIMNPLTRIKYHFWGKPNGNFEFLQIAKEIYREGGIRQFLLGSNATVQRDLLFGGIFALLRHEIIPKFYPQKEGKRSSSFTVNVIAGCAATIFSSPLNYIRNVHYSTPPSQRPDSAIKILKDLFSEAMKEQQILRRISLLQSRLRIGWGTARVGCGMAFGAKVYEYLVVRLS